MDVIDAVVSSLKLIAPPEHNLARQAGRRAGSGDRETGQLGVLIRSGVRHVHVAVGGEVGVKGQPENSGLDQQVRVQRYNRRRQQCPAAIEPDGATLLGNVDVAARREGDGCWILQARGQLNLGEPNRQVRKGTVSGLRRSRDRGWAEDGSRDQYGRRDRGS